MIIDGDTLSDLIVAHKAMKDTLKLIYDQIAAQPEGFQSFRPLLVELTHHVEVAHDILAAVYEENKVNKPPSGQTGRA